METPIEATAMTRNILNSIPRFVIPAVFLFAFACMWLRPGQGDQRVFETPANPSPVNLAYEISKLLG